MLRELALIPLVLPNALIGLVEDEPKEEDPNDPNEAGAKDAGEKAPLSELLDMAAIGDKPDMALIGLEKDIPGKPP